MARWRHDDPLDRTFAAVLFDMDGTLISSVASVVRAWTRVGQEYGIPAVDFDHLHGIPARDLVDSLLGDRPREDRDRALRRVIEIELEDTDDIQVLPGAAQALDVLVTTGRCAIVTSCTRDLALARLRAAGLRAPDVLVAAEDVARGKPDPEPFRTGAARLGVEVTDCVVAEDAAAGIASARAAGATTIALTTTMRADEIDGDVVVPDLSAVTFHPVPDGVRVRLAEPRQL
ncbi:HAD-IA family hydrolase [Cellulomonas sp. ATA003]|uniref:HAD-IA family hydrolase n=1 Tax=Cellulomonas sp. ATA003 TaxID=3073064 RepID=UPI002872FBAF|nr:HAD-IA family hydrolase [Cellulomonas sp. ATA003]WNB85338.1 HAD-IA family hydrolase [Cellulomonas sp. ATA003]